MYTTIQERFVGFVHAVNVNAESIKQYLFEHLKQINVDIKLLVGQCYDGANVMIGHRGGLQKLIREAVPCATLRIVILLLYYTINNSITILNVANETASYSS